MTPSKPTAFKRGAPDADTGRVTRPLVRRRSLLVVVASAALSVVVPQSHLVDERPTTERRLAALSIPVDDVLPEEAERAFEVAATPAPASTPAEVVEAPSAPAPADPVAEPDPCADALSWVADAGLPLPPGVGYHCPSTEFAHHGAACWNNRYCPRTGFIAVNLDLIGDPTPEYLRHVVAHEVCHILEFQATGWSTEASADACAAAHGAPRP